MPRLAAICIGSNRGLGAPTLAYAEKDAKDVGWLLAGAVGGFPGGAVNLVLAPTCEELRRELRRYFDQDLDLFVMFDAGHGSPRGLVLSDGVFTYDELAKFLRRINAKRSLVLLDVCHAGAFIEKNASLGGTIVGGADIDYLAALATATPGTRVMCSVGSNRNAGEGGFVQNGHFTAALIEAASVIDSPRGFLTERDLFRALAAISVARWHQLPKSLGLAANSLPIVRDQRRLEGGACVFDSGTTVDGVAVSAAITGRLGIPTRWRAQLATSQRILEEVEVRFVPDEDTFTSRFDFTTSGESIAADRPSRQRLSIYGATPLIWVVTLEDLRGRVLESIRMDTWWSLLAA